MQLTGEAEFNEVFLDDVFVPDDRVIGEVNDGWRVSSSTLTHERGTNPRQLVIHAQLLEELLRLAVANGALRRPPHRSSGWPRPTSRCASSSSTTGGRSPGCESGTPLGPEGCALKLYWSEMSKRLHDSRWTCSARRRRCGPAPTDNPGDGEWQRSWLYYQAASIFAGTNEIQRTIIGERVLGLPREPAPASAKQ